MSRNKGTVGSAGQCKPNDPEVMDLREEAEADLEDAMSLAQTPGASQMAIWHAGQSAEKYLRALGKTAGRNMSLLWDLSRVYETVRDLPGVDDLAVPVETITGALKNKAAGSPLGPQTLAGVLEAAKRVRAAVLKIFGEETEDKGPIRLEHLTIEAPEERPPEAPKERSGEGRTRIGRSESERRTSYVKVFLMCERCGVRIPRKQQTARGHVPCPLCGRPMVMAS